MRLFPAASEQKAAAGVARVVRKGIVALAWLLSGYALLVVTSWAFTPQLPADDTYAGEGRRHPSEVYNPVAAGEDLPQGFRQLLPRDGIRPIYDPQFTDAGDVGWPDDTQVIGVSAGSEAKAYPVSYLDQHEMVNDDIAGEPILVTW